MKIRIVSAALITALCGVSLNMPSAHSSVISPSSGCNQMNSSSYDRNYAGGPLLNFPTYEFAQGETLVVTTTRIDGSSATMGLFAIGSTTTSFTTSAPGTLSYTLTEDLAATGMGVTWSLTSSTGGFNADWVVECIPAAPPSVPETVSLPEHVQQVGRASDGDCTAIKEDELNWGGGISGGWSPSWAQWMNGGTGGPVCTRTIYFDSRMNTWSARK